MFKILLGKKAVKYYENLNDKMAKKVNKAIEDIVKNPFRGTNIKKLVGDLEGKYHYRLGYLRIVYSISNDRKIIFIEAIGPRGDVYK